MGRFHRGKLLSVIVLFCAASVAVCSAQVFKNLVDFEGANGEIPTESLAQGIDGNLYGTTTAGTYNNGTVFTITRAGSMTTLYSFCTQVGCPDGSNPSGLVLGRDGDLYGVTYGGGAYANGTVFKITPSGALTTLYSFCASQSACPDGALPRAALILASDGNFYGTTSVGGTGDCNSGCGTVFKITPAGVLTTLHSFLSREGWYPNGVIEIPNEDFYGTAYQGGANCGESGGCGTIFEMTKTGAVTVRYNFCGQTTCPDGNGPTSLIQARDGSFYGTTVSGGIQCSQYIPPCGTIFRITSRGTLTTLHSFDLADGANPNGTLIQATDGLLYGTTWYGGNITACSDTGCGTAFRMSPTGTLASLHQFKNSDGSVPFAGLQQATSGNFYGNTTGGGDLSCVDFEGNGCGTVFGLSVGLKPFVAFINNSGKVGQTTGVLGQGFTGTTAVSFDGLAANFKVVSETLLLATVPAEANTGYVTVTTPIGKLTSNLPFYVLR